MEALSVVDAALPQQFRHVLIGDELRHGLLPHALGNPDDCFDDELVGGVGAEAANEVAIDLEIVEGKMLQVKERAEASPKIVQREPAAPSPQLRGERLRALNVADRGCFGHLEDQGCGIDARVGERAIDGRNKLRVADGFCRDVQMERERPSNLGLCGDQRDRLLHDPGVDRYDRAKPFGDVQESTRREQVALIGAQPEEQLVLADLAVREIEDRLTVQLELIVRQRALNALGLHKPRR